MVNLKKLEKRLKKAEVQRAKQDVKLRQIAQKRLKQEELERKIADAKRSKLTPQEQQALVRKRQEQERQIAKLKNQAKSFGKAATNTARFIAKELLTEKRRKPKRRKKR